MCFPTGEGKTIFAFSLIRAKGRRGPPFRLKQLGENMHTNTFPSVLDSEKDRLEGLLSRRLGNRIRQLQIALRGSGVILRGRSETFYSKQLAQHAVMEFSDLPILANEIEVR